MSLLLKILGWLSIVSGIIAGIYVGNLTGDLMEAIMGYGYGGLQWDVAIAWWLSGIISGIVFFAFGMMLDKLQDLQERVYTLQKEIVLPKELEKKSSLAALAAETEQKKKSSLSESKGFNV